MNFRRIARLLGLLLMFLAACMATTLLWTAYYDEASTTVAFTISSLITFGAGLGTWWWGHNDKGTIFRSEAILLVAAGWLLLGLFGGLPFLLDEAFTNPVDAYFEAISGFTTTGSTVLTDISGQSRGLHWWRSLTHWLGGMGIIVLFVAIFPKLGVGGRFLFKSEVTGPITEGLKPKIKEAAATLWWIYLSLTVALALLLLLLGMDLHEAICHAFATLATGGFSTRNASIAEFDSVGIDTVITLFMLLAGINFGLYFGLIRGQTRRFFRDTELRVYLAVILVATVAITLNIYGAAVEAHHETVASSFRYAVFQVVAIITSTGFATDNFDLYPPLSRLLLVFLMFMGGMAGSTAGGMKVIRFIVLAKAIYAEIYKVFRPQSVLTVRIGGAVIAPEVTTSILGFFALGILTFAGASLFMAALGLDIVTATTAVAATLFNIGPGLAQVGAIENFAFIPTAGKALLSFCMILGRLEFMTILVLLLPEFWKR